METNKTKTRATTKPEKPDMNTRPLRAHTDCMTTQNLTTRKHTANEHKSFVLHRTQEHKDARSRKGQNKDSETL